MLLSSVNSCCESCTMLSHWPGPHWRCMQPAYDNMQPAYSRMHGADSIGLQCVIVGVDARMYNVSDTLHATVCRLHTTVECRLHGSGFTLFVIICRFVLYLSSCSSAVRCGHLLYTAIVRYIVCLCKCVDYSV